MQKSIIVGTLLGDGYITKSSVFTHNQGIKNKLYSDHLYHILCPFSNPIGFYDKKTKNEKTYKSVRVTLKVNEFAKKMRNIAYNEKGTKIITDELLDLVDEVALAYWFMDDGSRWIQGRHKVGVDRKKPYFSTVLCTSSFTEPEVRKIISFLDRRFGINGKIKRLHKKSTKKTYFDIKFNKTESYKLRDIISKYMIPSMQYKFCEA
jgi:hypothetical protein